MNDLKEKDIAVLVGLQDKDWVTNTSDLREHINNERNDVPDLSLSGINYRLGKFHVVEDDDEEQNELGWLRTEDRGKTETGTNAAKKIIVEDKQSIIDALEKNSNMFADNYDSMSTRLGKVDERSQENKKTVNENKERLNEHKEMIKSTEDKFEKGLIAGMAILGASKNDIKNVKSVIDEDSETTLNDVL